MLKLITTSAVSAFLLLSSAAYADNQPTAGTSPSADMSQPADNDSMMSMREKMHEKMAEKWAKMTPEEKAKVQERLKERWEKATPEEKQAFVEQVVMKFKSLPDDKQKEVLEKIKEAGSNNPMPASSGDTATPPATNP